MKTWIFIIIIAALFIIAPSAHAAINATSASLSTGPDIVLSLINQDPDPATAGDVVEVRIGIENGGQQDVSDLVAEFEPSYPFQVATGEENIKSVGTLLGYQVGSDMKIVRFLVKVDRDAVEGTYNFKILTYEKGQKSVASTEQTVSIEVSSQQSAEIIYIDQVELVPGQVTPLSFTINNVGSSPLRDLTFSWENADDVILPVGSDDTKYVKYIGIGDSAKLVYNVIASATATPDLYKLDLTLSYNDPTTGGSTEVSTAAGVYVGGATDFDVAYSSSSGAQSSFSISNIGSVAASSVTVRIPQQPGWTVSGSNSVIIGNLNEGDYTIASFNVQSLSSVTTGTQSSQTGQPTRPTGAMNQTGFPRRSLNESMLNIEIVYTDSRGNRHNVTKSVAFQPSTTAASTGTMRAPGEFGSSTSVSITRYVWAGVGLAVIVFLFIVHTRYRKRKLDESDYTYGRAMKDVFKRDKRKRR